MRLCADLVISRAATAKFRADNIVRSNCKRTRISDPMSQVFAFLFYLFQ